LSKAKRAKLSDLKPDRHNANRGTQRGRAYVEDSIRQHGLGRSILVDREGKIIAGNKTHEAAGGLGFEDAIVVPTDGRQLVVVQRTDVDLDSPEGAALAIADNRAAELGLDWDPDELAHLADTFDLDLDGLDLGHIELPDADGAPEGDPDAVPEVKEEATSRTGDLWLLGEHRVLCGDSTSAEDVARLMGGRSADSLITDPPYGVSYADKNEFLNAFDRGNRVQTEIENDHLTIENIGPFWRSVFSLMLEHTKQGGTYYMTGPQGGDLSMMMMMMQESGWLLKHVLIWAKNNHVLGRCDYNYKHEPILYGWKPGAGHYFGGTGSDTSLWEFDKPLSSKLHPTMKPVALIAHAATRAARKGEVILDPFLGSGTAVIACEDTGRKCYGLELSPNYVDVIAQRWQEYTGKAATLDGDGRTFAEVVEARAAEVQG